MLGAARGDDSFELGHPLFQFVDLGPGAGKHLGLHVELFASDQVEAAQSLRQNIPEVGAQILLHLCQSWRYQRHKSQGNLIDILLVHHGQRLELVGVNAR